MLGFSYGALPSILEKVEIRKKVLICPFIFSQNHIGKKSTGEDIFKTLRFLKKAYPNVYRINFKKFIKELTNVKLPVENKKIIYIFAKDDKSISALEADMIKKRYKNSEFILKDGGHSIMIEDDFMKKLCNI